MELIRYNVIYYRLLGIHKMPYMNLEAARREMKKSNVDALVATSPTTLRYTSGYYCPMGFLPGITLMPADSAIEPVMIISSFEESMAKKVSEFLKTFL